MLTSGSSNRPTRFARTIFLTSDAFFSARFRCPRLGTAVSDTGLLCLAFVLILPILSSPVEQGTGVPEHSSIQYHHVLRSYHGGKGKYFRPSRSTKINASQKYQNAPSCTSLRARYHQWRKRPHHHNICWCNGTI